jgi:hypothetical protein
MTPSILSSLLELGLLGLLIASGFVLTVGLM